MNSFVSAYSPPSSNSTFSNPLLVLSLTTQNFQNDNDTTYLLPNVSLQCDTTDSSVVAVSTPIAGFVPQNTHPMTTRVKASVFKPKTYASYKEGSYDHTVEPHIVKEAMAKPEWLKAMKEEHDALIRNDTWSLVDPPPGCKPIGCKWVFKSNFNVDGSFQRHKARLVAKGYHQREGFDFKETFSPMIKPTTIRTILSLVVFLAYSSSGYQQYLFAWRPSRNCIYDSTTRLCFIQQTQSMQIAQSSLWLETGPQVLVSQTQFDFEVLGI